MRPEDRYLDVNLCNLRFTYSKINPHFSCGRTLQSTLKSLHKKEITLEDLPALTILMKNPSIPNRVRSNQGRLKKTHQNDKQSEIEYYCLNNRRLYVIKRYMLEAGLFSREDMRVGERTFSENLDSEKERQCEISSSINTAPLEESKERVKSSGREFAFQPLNSTFSKNELPRTLRVRVRPMNAKEEPKYNAESCGLYTRVIGAGVTRAARQRQACEPPNTYKLDLPASSK